MEVLKNLLNRFRHSAVLVLIGFFLIIYIAFGFVYFQQSAKQAELEEQSAKISSIVAKELPDKEDLQAEYDEVNRILTMADVESSGDEDITTDAKAIEILVGIAAKSGIDTDSDKLSVPSASPREGREGKVGGGTYQVFSFKNVSVQGSYDSVMAFISDLDSGETRATMVLGRVDIRQIKVKGESGGEVEGEVEEETRTETIATLDVDLYTKPGDGGI